MSPLSLLLLGSTAIASSQIPFPNHVPTSGYTTQDHSQNYHFAPLLHLPGISPYFDAIGVGLEHRAPLGCNITAASYLVRHAAIYANDHDYDTFMAPFLAKLTNNTSSTSNPATTKQHQWTGPLAVLNTWTNPYIRHNISGKQLETITPDGARSATEVGAHLLRRYPDLVATTRKVYADKKSRTQDTARAFVRAFPQQKQHGRQVEVVEISSEKEFQSTIPHKSCPAFSKSAGDDELFTFIDHYTRGSLARLQPHAPVRLTAKDVVGMQQLCGYESAIDGGGEAKASPICAIFTPTEWLAYEYAWDLKYHYMVGPGNALSPYLGFPWLNVTRNLFRKFHRQDFADFASSSVTEDRIRNDDEDEDSKQRFFVSFTHREVPPFLATALGLFGSPSSSSSSSSSSNHDHEEFPTSRINFQRSWKMAELIPFLGHIGIEKMTCDRSSGAGADGDADEDGLTEWVRVIGNSAPRPIPRCQQGPGASCGWKEFEELVSEGMEVYGDFNGVCGVKEKVDIEWK